MRISKYKFIPDSIKNVKNTSNRVYIVGLDDDTARRLQKMLAYTLHDELLYKFLNLNELYGQDVINYWKNC